MFKFINKLFSILLYLFSVLIIFVSTYVYLIDNNKIISFIYNILENLYKNTLFIPILFVCYFIIKTLSFFDNLFEKEEDYKVKLKDGEIKVKRETLNTFARDFLLKNPLIKNVKVKSKQKSSKIIINATVYTYDITKISERLAMLREELATEINQKLLLEVSKVNLLIANIENSSSVKEMVEKNDNDILEKSENKENNENKEE